MNFILPNGPLLTRCSGAIRWLSSSRNQITMANSAAAPGRRFSPAYRSRPIAAPAVLADGRPTCDVTPRARSACIISSLHQHVFSDAPPCVSDWLIRIAVCLRGRMYMNPVFAKATRMLGALAARREPSKPEPRTGRHCKAARLLPQLACCDGSCDWTEHERTHRVTSGG